VKTRSRFFAVLLLVTPVITFGDVPSSQFVSAVQFAVQDSSPELVQRSQVLVRQQFARNLELIPAFHDTPYEVRTFGNEVVFYLVTPSDVGIPMKYAVSSLIQDLTGKVRMRGRSSVYLTKLAQPRSGYLETIVNDKHTHIMSILAQSVPLRDLLKQLKTQLGSFSYLIPGECAEKRVDLNFGEEGSTPAPKTIDMVLGELATLFNLKLEKKNDTMIFSGACDSGRPTRSVLSPTELLTASLDESQGPYPNPRPQQIVFPVLPLGQ
jgi:hypothetical protein